MMPAHPLTRRTILIDLLDGAGKPAPFKHAAVSYTIAAAERQPVSEKPQGK